MNINQLEQLISKGAETRKTIHHWHKENLKNNCINLWIQDIINNIKNNANNRRTTNKILKELEEEQYLENRQKINLIVLP